ncbi:MAG: hypothetical protein ACI3YK_03905 [Eubacteriales bacterium]
MLCAAVVVCSGIECVLIWWLNANPEIAYEPIGIIATMAMGLLYMATSLAIVIMFFFLLHYFYTNLMTDEGYLTFTLPTTPGKILLSKIIVSLCCMALVAFFVYAGMVMTSLIESCYSEDLFSGAEESVSTIELVWTLLMLISNAISSVLMLLMAFFSITLGCCTAKKNRVGASVGFFVLMVIGYSFLYTIITLFLQMGMEESVDSLVVLCIQSGIIIGLGCALSVLFFFLSRYLLTHKLNLQ